MPFDFDRVIDRRNTHSTKWTLYPPDILPLWVADMDFAVPEPIQVALQQKVDLGIFGYERVYKELLLTVADRMKRLYDWQVTADMVVAIPGVISGFNLAARVTCKPGEGLLVQPPVYPPFFKVHENLGLVHQVAPLTQVNTGSSLHYEVDWGEFKAALNSEGVHTGMFLLCQPHNPTGAIYTRDQMTRLAEICLENNTIICSDDIHSEILLGGSNFTPMAVLAPEIADRTITLVAPSKTFNVAGLYCAFAIIPSPDLRQSYRQEMERATMHLNSLGMAAAQVAFSGECDPWLHDLLVYLTANRDVLVDFVRQELSGVRCTVPDATFLAWLDFNDLIRVGKVPACPYKYFLKDVNLSLNDGATFGPGGEGFVRLNFGCPRSTMLTALQRIRTSLERI